MNEKVKKTGQIILQEVVGNGIGYAAGLGAYELVSAFFVKRGIFNLWGLATSKKAVSASAFGFLEIFTAAVIGFAVLQGVNYLIDRFLLKNNQENEPEKEEQI